MGGGEGEGGMEGAHFGRLAGQRPFQVAAPLVEDSGGQEVDVGVGQLWGDGVGTDG